MKKILEPRQSELAFKKTDSFIDSTSEWNVGDSLGNSPRCPGRIGYTDYFNQNNLLLHKPPQVQPSVKLVKLPDQEKGSCYLRREIEQNPLNKMSAYNLRYSQFHIT